MLFYFTDQVPSLSNRDYVITGGTNGIGLSIARTLFTHGAKVHIIGSNESNAEAAIAYIKTGDLKSAPDDYAAGFGHQEDLSGEVDKNIVATVEGGQVEWTHCDLHDLNEVAKVGKELAQNLDKLDGCFFIAGIGVNEFKLTKDGYESVSHRASSDIALRLTRPFISDSAHLTINNLSHHLLLSHLFPLLEKVCRKRTRNRLPKLLSQY